MPWRADIIDRLLEALAEFNPVLLYASSLPPGAVCYPLPPRQADRPSEHERIDLVPRANNPFDRPAGQPGAARRLAPTLYPAGGGSGPPPCQRLVPGLPRPNGQLAAKLTSTNNEVYYGALDEFHVHQVLRRLEPDVRYEEGGQGPDFRVYRDGHQVLAVEVLSLFLRPEWARQARQHGELTDRLNRTFRPQSYFLHVEVLVQDPSRNLPLKALTRAAGAFLEDLPEPQVATAAYENGQPLPWRDVERDGFYVRFEALPMKPNTAALTDPDARIVGMGPVIGGPVDSHARLKERLNAKRKKPYVLDPSVPYVLAVGNHDPFCSDLQLLMAIYGRDWEALIGGREPLWQDELRFRGFFGIDKGEPPYHTRFSAAAVINGAVMFHHPSTMEWLVFDNPHARVRLPDGLLPTTHRFQALDRSRWGWRPPRPLP